MKNISLILLTFLFSFQIIAQTEQNGSIKDSIQPAEDYFDRITFNLGGGVFIPQGELKRYFGTGPLLELNFNFPINKNKSIDIMGQFIIPNQVEEFAFIRTIDTVRAKSQMMFNFLGKFNKTIKTTLRGELKAFLGLGVSTITTNARNPFYSGAENENKYEFISALLIAPGIDYKFNLSQNSKLSIGISYHYSPYKVEGALREDIGSSAIIPRLLFSF